MLPCRPLYPVVGKDDDAKRRIYTRAMARLDRSGAQFHDKGYMESRKSLTAAVLPSASVDAREPRDW